ncbi:hypothetical protein FQ775_01200 [Nitratireductor mangrovi]|uniref:Uncharacterized protein n=1 Tax=Nitratireductor mangrovi TaxID=2599600 RepID=A0A5B8KU41_9HYPH|nr:hypothetical protein [Nitratireductor mangrovi]QDY99098.1 hypothetical protein FQ775_01200 [Nitratireductor mangrovi]
MPEADEFIVFPPDEPCFRSDAALRQLRSYLAGRFPLHGFAVDAATVKGSDEFLVFPVMGTIDNDTGRGRLKRPPSPLLLAEIGAALRAFEPALAGNTLH